MRWRSGLRRWSGASVAAKRYKESQFDAEQTDMEVCPDTAGECCNRDAVEALSWYATVGGIKTEMRDVQTVSHVRKPSMQTVISSTTSHKAKRDETQPRVVTL